MTEDGTTEDGTTEEIPTNPLYRGERDEDPAFDDLGEFGESDRLSHQAAGEQYGSSGSLENQAGGYRQRDADADAGVPVGENEFLKDRRQH